MITISPATLADYPDLIAIEQQAHPYPWSPATLADCLSPHYYNWKICEHHRPLGFIISHISLDEGSIFNLAIAPQVQRRGLGTQLLNHALATMKAQKVSSVFLEVRHTNQAAQKLYSTLGFELIGVRKGYYSTQTGREDALVMRKVLSSPT